MGFGGSFKPLDLSFSLFTVFVGILGGVLTVTVREHGLGHILTRGDESSGLSFSACARARLPVLLSRSNTGNTFRLHQALNLADRAKVLVLGGSLTVGHDAGGMEYAWPALLARENCTGLGMIENRAKASTGSNYALANLVELLHPLDWDIVFLEYALNDDDVGDGARYSSIAEVSITSEKLIRSIHHLVPKAAVVEIECFRQSKGAHLGFMSGQNQHDIVSKYYEIPVISVREALWHDYFELREKSSLWEAFPVGKSHPSREGQKIISDIVARELRLFRREPPTLLRDRTPFPPLLFSEEEANKDDALLSASWTVSLDFEGRSSSSVVSQPRFLSQQSFGWTYVRQETKYNDTAAGMICNRTFPNVLQIDIGGCVSVLQIGYLKSYDTFGSANLILTGTSSAEDTPTFQFSLGVLQSRWDRSRGSGTFTDKFDLKDALRTIKGIQNVLSISVIHDVDVDKQAFKVMYIRCY